MKFFEVFWVQKIDPFRDTQLSIWISQLYKLLDRFGVLISRLNKICNLQGAPVDLIYCYYTPRLKVKLETHGHTLTFRGVNFWKKILTKFMFYVT